MNTPDDQYWRSIFSLLLKEQQPEVGGREGIPEELRSKLEQLAQGGFDKAEIQNICERIVLLPDALSTLARLLRDAKGNASSEKES